MLPEGHTRGQAARRRADPHRVSNVVPRAQPSGSLAVSVFRKCAAHFPARQARSEPSSATLAHIRGYTRNGTVEGWASGVLTVGSDGRSPGGSSAFAAALRKSVITPGVTKGKTRANGASPRPNR